MEQPEPVPPFRWRREWPFALIPAIVALIHRIPTAKYAEMVWNGDGSLVCLMAKHHWKALVGEPGYEHPIYFYGQKYNGTIEAGFAAPFYGMTESWGLHTTIVGMGYSQAVLSAIVLLFFYRVCWMVGGRWGSVVACTVSALGTMALVDDLCGHQHSYQIHRLLGCLVVLVAIPFLRQPTPKTTFGLGLLAGIGMFNNPQVLAWLIPVGALLFLQGRTCELIRKRELGRTLGSLRTPLKILFLLLVLNVVVCIAVSIIQPGKLGKISLARPYEYLKRAVGILGMVIVCLELGLNLFRWKLVGKFFAIFGVAFLIGNTPNIYYVAHRKLNDIPIPRGATTGITLSPDKIKSHWKDLKQWGGYTLFNFREPWPHHVPWTAGKEKGYVLWRDVIMLLTLIGGLGVLWHHRDQLRDVVALRPTRPSLAMLLGLHTVVVLGLWMTYPRYDQYARYLLSLWLPFCAMLAGGFAFLIRRAGRAVAVGTATAFIAFYVMCTVHNIDHIRFLHEHDYNHMGAYKQIRDTIIAESQGTADYRQGYCNYFWGYRITYISDEAITLRPWPEFQPELYVPFVERAKRANHVVWIFNPVQANPDDTWAMNAFFERVDKGELVIDFVWRISALREHVHGEVYRPADRNVSFPYIVYFCRVVRR